METTLDSGESHISVNTKQEEYRYHYEEPVEKDTLAGIIALAPLPEGTWHPPDEITVGGVMRVDAR